MDIPSEMLLHPELLSNDQLKYIILQRHLKLVNMQIMSRDDLLEVFHQYCVPYGQRRYRDSGRGKVLNKTRHLSPERPPVLNTMNNNHSKRTINNNDRIKPPPDLLSGHMKRIKLENNTMPGYNINNNKRKMSVDAVSPITNGSPPNKKERKPITWP